MEDISLHLLDVMENSIRAGAKMVSVSIREDDNHTLLIVVEDDGQGMDADARTRALDPFYTTKEGKKTGLGLPLFARFAEETDGEFRIESPGPKGLRITASFHTEHPDMRPLGDIPATLQAVMVSHPEIDFVCTYDVQGERFLLDTRKMKEKI